MARPIDTAYIVFDTESVVDGALLSRVAYAGEDLSPDDAVSRYTGELADRFPGKKPFIPVSFHVPVAVAVARVDSEYRLLDIGSLDTPRFDSRAMVDLFWRGVEFYRNAAIVDFNGRGFDLPLMTLSAFRFGIACPRYFADPDRFGFRYRFTQKHMDLMEWITEYGAASLVGGLNLLAKMLGKPGKMETSGDQVAELHARGEVQRINDYCLHDVLDTYFVFLRTRVLTGQLSLEEEQQRVAQTRSWLEERVGDQPGLKAYLDEFGEWDPTPFE